jgi:hypothetical protein
MRRARGWGQNPRRLQLKATRCSAWQDSQRTRRNRARGDRTSVASIPAARSLAAAGPARPVCDQRPPAILKASHAMRTRRWILCLVACARACSRRSGRMRRSPQEPDVKPRKPPDENRQPGSRVQLETLRPRPRPGRLRTRSRRAHGRHPLVRRRRSAARRSSASPTPAVPLGRIVDGDATVVMLARENVSFVVRLGDTLERDYRVARIG